MDLLSERGMNNATTKLLVKGLLQCAKRTTRRRYKVCYLKKKRLNTPIDKLLCFN